MLLMMLGVGRRRWTTRQNILHQASTIKYALLTRPCLKVLLSSADNRGDSRSKEIHSRLGQVLLSTTSAINPPLFLNLFYRIDPIISIRVFFFHYWFIPFPQKWEVQREQGDRARGRRPVLINLRYLDISLLENLTLLNFTGLAKRVWRNEETEDRGKRELLKLNQYLRVRIKNFD